MRLIHIYPYLSPELCISLHKLLMTNLIIDIRDYFIIKRHYSDSDDFYKHFV